MNSGKANSLQKPKEKLPSYLDDGPKGTYGGRLKHNFILMVELFRLIKERKKWWLLPIYFVLAFLGLFVALVGGQSVLPAIYALF